MKVRATKTIRYGSKTYLIGQTLEVKEKHLQDMIDKKLVENLDASELKSHEEKMIKIPISYGEISKLSHKELDSMCELLEIKSEGTIQERSNIIWATLSAGYEKVVEDE